MLLAVILESIHHMLAAMIVFRFILRHNLARLLFVHGQTYGEIKITIRAISKKAETIQTLMETSMVRLIKSLLLIVKIMIYLVG